MRMSGQVREGTLATMEGNFGDVVANYGDNGWQPTAKNQGGTQSQPRQIWTNFEFNVSAPD